MIVIVASRWDRSSHDLAARWSEFDARVLTPRDLSRTGWRQRLGQPAQSTAVVDGKVVQEKAITGVLVRLPFVDERELVHIADEDKSYSASEMTAFLSFWLGHLSCAVLHCSTSNSLIGPEWLPEIWASVAARAGFFVNPLTSRSPQEVPDQAEEASGLSVVTVVGEQCFGETSLFEPARRLAKSADVQLLSVYHSTSETAPAAFLGANLLPDLAEENIAAAVLQLLLPQGH